MWQTKQLILHGSIILLLGLLSGAPFGRAIVRGHSEASVRGWRVAHSGLTLGGLLLLVVALVVPQLKLSAPALIVMVAAFVASGYAFAVALPLGAYGGHRGLTAGSPFVNRIVYAGNTIGAAGSLVGTLILVWGAYAAL